MLFGQSQNGAIVGVVSDGTGAVVPGAKVTITSPALQVRSLTTTTDPEGNFKLTELPAPGVYHLTVEAKGFRTSVQDGINLPVGFTAKLEPHMTVGEISQTVQVTASGPVVDTVSTASASTLELEDIVEAPKGLGLQELLPMAAGVSLQGKPDVGDSNLANRQPVVTYGVVLEPTLLVEGINTVTAKDADSSVYLDSLALAEVEFTTSGNNADVAFPGVAQVAVMKSGGNTFHGDVQGDYENPSFQGNNVSPAQAAPPSNLSVGNPLGGSGYFDYVADIGGRIITDKLWFYGGYSKQSVTQGQVNFFGAPDAAGCWTCTDAKPANIVTSLTEYNYKVSYQLKRSTKLLFSELHGTKYLSANSASTLVPLPSSQYEIQPGASRHVEVQTAIGSRLVINGGFGYAGYHVSYTSEPASITSAYGFPNGSDFAGSPSEEELSTKAYTGPYPFTQDKPQNRYELRVNVHYLPAKPHLGMTHQFSLGTVEDWEYAGTRVLNDKPSGDYLLQFQNGLPNKFVAYNYPFPTSINTLLAPVRLPYGYDRHQAPVDQRGHPWRDLRLLLSRAGEARWPVQRALSRAVLPAAGHPHLDRCCAARRRFLGCLWQWQDGHQGFLRALRRHHGRYLRHHLQPQCAAKQDLHLDRSLPARRCQRSCAVQLRRVGRVPCHASYSHPDGADRRHQPDPEPEPEAGPDARVRAQA